MTTHKARSGRRSIRRSIRRLRVILRSQAARPVPLRKVVVATVLVIGVAAGAVTLADAWMRRAMQANVYRQMATIPTEPVAIVLGALVYPNGALSPVLQARVEAAVELYKAGKVSKLLMTGDNSSVDYDEVTPMKGYAVSLGVPEIDVVRDYAGFRTFDSCYRAKHIFRVDKAVMVTQDFHISRAVYLARSCGIDAVGYVAPDDMSESAVASLRLREKPAAFAALLDTHNPWKRPHFGGKAEPIMASAPGR